LKHTVKEQGKITLKKNKVAGLSFLVPMSSEKLKLNTLLATKIKIQKIKMSKIKSSEDKNCKI